MRRSTIALAFTLGATSLVPGASGWGAAGHEIIATIAQVYLHPDVLPTVCSLIHDDEFTGLANTTESQPCYLASIATWADEYKFHMRWSAALHYVGAVDDHPADTCLFPGANNWAGSKNHNVLAAIRNTSDILIGYQDAFKSGSMAGASEDRAIEALKFLVHFVGDMHMPLHLTGRDRGGNGDKVLFDGRTTNLHSVWDNRLIAKSLRTIPSNYTHPLPSERVESVLRGAIYDPYVRRVFYEGLNEDGGRFAEKFEEWLACPTPEELRRSREERELAKVSKTWSEAIWGYAQSVLPFVRKGVEMDETDDAFICPYYWAKPIHRLNCEIVWPKVLDLKSSTNSTSSTSSGPSDSTPGIVSGHPDLIELDTPAYAGRIHKEWLVERLMAMAGIRLAAVLNGIFAPEDGLSRFDALSIGLKEELPTPASD